MGNKLNITTPSDLEIVMTRTFDAPRALVWEAMSKPELIKQWLFSPPGWSMIVCEEDVRVGGAFRWQWGSAEGPGMSMHGVYREVAPPQRLVRTELFDFGCGIPEGGGAEQVCTLVLQEENGKTHLTLTAVYPSKEARDGALASGMEEGVKAGYNQLDELLSAKVSA